MAKKPVVELDLIFQDSKSKNFNSVQNQFQNLCLQMIRNEASLPEFKNLKLYTLGSLSYGGLCPYSDVDLLAVGEKVLTERFAVQLATKLNNVKIKWWPKLDYNLATDIFDHISLFFQKELFNEHKTELEHFKSTQKDWIAKHLDVYQLELQKDRRLRRSRYGDVGGELAPNIKYGPGGLRDSCQALAWTAWQPKSAVQDELLSKLGDNLKQIYQFRFILQMLFQTDQLSLEQWPDILKALKWSDSEKKSFYQTLYQQFTLTDLIFNNTSFDLAKDFKSFIENSNSAHFDIKILSTLSAQGAKILAYHLKTTAFQIETMPEKTPANVAVKNANHERFNNQIFDWIHELFSTTNEDWQIDFILDSGLLGSLLPEWYYISGLTQSDHYHKYTVSEHLRQTLKAVCRLQTNEDLRFSMHSSSEELTISDWALLKWVAVFHDLKKGHPEDHSALGKLTVESFECFNEEQSKTIAALVEHHLRLSTFAFRFEHSDLAQLETLNQLFEASHWIRLLLIFTGADIMGSNPKAWNKWKSDQLYFAYKSLMDHRNEKINVEAESFSGFELSPQLVKVIGRELLHEDINLLEQDLEDGQPKENWLVESIDNNLWVRVFKVDSGPGTLSQILNTLYLAGLPVEQAFIASSNTGFVYNWFRLPSTFEKPEAQIQKRLKILNQQTEFREKTLMAQVEKVIFLTENKDKLSFLFKGQDQNGVLLYISKIFESLGVNIHKAQINTWGQRLEDLFVVKKEGHDPEILLEQLNKSLKIPQSIKI